MSLTTQDETYREKFLSMGKDIKWLKQDLSNKTCVSLYHKEKYDQINLELEN